jgi:acyl carrier protein
MTTEETVRQFIVKELLWDGGPQDLSQDTSLIEGGVIDSAGIVKMVSFLETEFAIEIPDEEVILGNFDTLDSISAFVNGKRAAS